MNAPPRPEAVPARCGRTESMPALALGSTMPLPRPTKVISPKNATTECVPESDSATDVVSPATVSSEPHRIIRSMPTATENRPETKLPAK